MGKVRSNKKKEGNMKKIFLTSGLVLCMACPAFATPLNGTTAIPATDSNDNPVTTAMCVDETLGTASNGYITTFVARWINNIGTITLDSDYYANGGNTATYTTANGDNGLVGSSPNPVYSKYADGMYQYFDSNTGNVTMQISNVSVPSMTGYAFMGYFDTKAHAYDVNLGDTGRLISNAGVFETGADTYVTTAGGSATWYARWVAQQYDVNYHVGAHGSCAANSSCGTTTAGVYIDANGATYDESYAALDFADADMVEATGYTFVGWSENQNATATPASNALTGGTINNNDTWIGEDPWKTADDNAEVYAIYVANRTAITYDCGAGIANSGSTGSFKSNATQGATATYDSNYSHPTAADTCEMTGYTATGWNCTANNTAVANNGIGTNNDAGKWKSDDRSVTCTAVWSQNTITLQFTGDGNWTVQDTSCHYDESFTLPTNVTQTGYTFDGWEVQSTPVAPANPNS